MMNRKLLVLTALLLLGAASCGHESEGADEGLTGLTISMPKLEATCSASTEPGAISELLVKVLDRSVSPAEVVAEESFSGDSTTLKMTVAESTNLELSILGYQAGDPDTPAFFARAKNIAVTKDLTTDISLSLNKLGGYNCVTPPSSATNVLFPTVTDLPDGRLLVAGGFTKVSEESGRYEIYGASNRAYIYDPNKNEMRQAANLMNMARGAHAAVFMPKKQQVILIGGSERLYFEKGGGEFPLYFEKGKVGSVGSTYELFDIETEQFIPNSEWPDETTRLVLNIARVFPVAVLNNDGTVLVTGGGLWPSAAGTFETDADYQQAELYRPVSLNYPEGGFMETGGALTMSTIRTGHAGVLLETKDKLRTHLFWGGNQEGPVAEIYRESSGQLDGNFGVFTQLSMTDSTNYSKKPYFHSLTPLATKRFLLAGGVHNSKGKLKVPSKSDAFLVTVDSEYRVSVDTVGGLEVGRYLHSAVSYDSQHVVLMGGFSAVTQGEDTLFSDSATADIRIFDLATKELVAPEFDDAMIPRAGHGSAVLPNDCVFLVGGVDQPAVGLENGPAKVGLMSEVYCPRVLCPSGLWDSVCYTEE